MRTVIQRVTHAAVRIGDRTAGEIGPGLLLLLGVGPEDTEEQADYLAAKTVNMRIFEDENGKDIGGEILVVSQFTLYADCRKGNRPSFTGAAAPEPANRLYEYFKKKIEELGIPVACGEFGAEMKVSLENDGPVTILLER